METICTTSQGVKNKIIALENLIMKLAPNSNEAKRIAVNRLDGLTAEICNDNSMEDTENAIKTILNYIGEDANRSGLKDTPARMIRMWEEIFRGYDKNKKPKITTFDNGTDGIVYDNMIVDTGYFYSVCEHHFMPFFGTYHFAYIPHPNGKIIGLSKVARVVDYYSAKLQIQERLVSDIVREINNALGKENPCLGIALVLKGQHLCKSMRGVKKQGQMITSHLTGIFKEQEARTEFMNLIK